VAGKKLSNYGGEEKGAARFGVKREPARERRVSEGREKNRNGKGISEEKKGEPPGSNASFWPVFSEQRARLIRTSKKKGPMPSKKTSCDRTREASAFV